MHYLKNILEAIGNTPMIKLNKMSPASGASILLKPEYLNPAGSIKDRMALYIIEKAERDGLLVPGGTIVENTSGNTGAGVAMIAAVKGYKAIFTMPDKMSAEKIDLLKAFGARVVITPTDVPANSPRSYYETAKRIAGETPNSFYLNQYHNPDNIEAHYYSTGPEIYEQADGKIDYFVAGIGTGGTMSGVGKYLKEKLPKIKNVGVDPIGSVFYDYFKTGKLVEPHVYKVEGIGEDMLTGAMDFSVVDDIIQVSDRDCFLTARELARKEGVFAGGSSGGVVHAALKVARQANPDEVVVAILPDSGTRYLSKCFNDGWMVDNGFAPYESIGGLVSDILKGRRLEPVTIKVESPVKEAIHLMKKYDISQLPVCENTEIVGMVYETDLLRALAMESIGPNDPIRNVAEKHLSKIAPNAPVFNLAKAFTETGEAVLVMEDQKLVAVLTKIDLISFLAGGKS